MVFPFVRCSAYSIMAYLRDRRHVGGVRRADTYLVPGCKLQNVGDEQGSEAPMLIEGAGEIIGPDAVERDLVRSMLPTPVQSHVEQRLTRPTASLVGVDEQGVDIGGTMANLLEFGIDETNCSAFGFGDESSTGFGMLPGSGQEWPDGFFRSNLPPLGSKHLNRLVILNKLRPQLQDYESVALLGFSYPKHRRPLRAC